MIASLGGSFIRCPQCDGDGYVEVREGLHGWPPQVETRRCPICECSHVGDPDGCLVLPLNPDVADVIYSNGSATVMELVYDASAEGETIYRTEEDDRAVA